MQASNFTRPGPGLHPNPKQHAEVRIPLARSREPSEAIVSQDLTVFFFFGFPLAVQLASVGIDVERNVIIPASKVGDPQQEVGWMFASGSIGSGAEHATFEQLYGVTSVSTERLLVLANRAGIPVFSDRPAQPHPDPAAARPL